MSHLLRVLVPKRTYSDSSIILKLSTARPQQSMDDRYKELFESNTQRMVSNFTQNLLQCGICLETMTQDPVTLNCTHSFCLCCITEWCIRRMGYAETTCPTCRTETTSVIRSASHQQQLEAYIPNLSEEERQQVEESKIQKQTDTRTHIARGYDLLKDGPRFLNRAALLRGQIRPNIQPYLSRSELLHLEQGSNNAAQPPVPAPATVRPPEPIIVGHSRTNPVQQRVLSMAANSEEGSDGAAQPPVPAGHRNPRPPTMPQEPARRGPIRTYQTRRARNNETRATSRPTRRIENRPIWRY